MDNIKTLGLMFGDETKGSFIDYLSRKNTDIIYFVKYNGGCQASHNVVISDRNIKFKFSQLSPSMINEKNHTILGSNFIINLTNLENECIKFSNVMERNISDIISKIHIDLRCVCVTPIHKVYNILDETFETKRGSVGTGVSIAAKWKENNDLNITVKDLLNSFKTFEDYKKVEKKLINQCNEVKNLLENVKKYKNFKIVWKELNYKFKIDKLLNYKEYLNSLCSLLNTYHFEFVDTDEIISLNSCIFESSQGFLLDRDYGIYPNITYMNTTMSSIFEKSGQSIGFIRCYLTRHGPGFFITEDDYLAKYVIDTGQEIGIFNGGLRLGWLDIVLLRYSLSKNKIDKIYMSCLDLLNTLENFKICIKYKYQGNIDDLFKKLFDFSLEKNIVYIHNIKENHRNLLDYLKLCEPVYDYLDLSDKTNMERINFYVSKIEKFLNKQISVISVGEKFEDKIEKEKNNEFFFSK